MISSLMAPCLIIRKRVLYEGMMCLYVYDVWKQSVYTESSIHGNNMMIDDERHNKDLLRVREIVAVRSGSTEGL